MGRAVGINEGSLVGDKVGSAVGLRVGIEVDTHVGFDDCTTEGAMVGSPALGVGRYDG